MRVSWRPNFPTCSFANISWQSEDGGLADQQNTFPAKKAGGCRLLRPLFCFDLTPRRYDNEIFDYA